MTDIRELYQEVILDHNKSPRNFRKLESASRIAEGANPLCGDEVTVYVELDGDLIADVGFQGQGCAIAKASASLMTISLKGKTMAEAEALFQEVHRMLTVEGEQDLEALGRLAVLVGVRNFPIRVKCATLAWHTARGALQRRNGIISTE